MQLFTINDTPYEILTFSELTLGQFIQLLRQEPKMPQLLKDVYSGDVQLKDVTDEEYNTIFLPYFVDYVSFATECPKDVLYNVNKEEVERLYNICSSQYTLDAKTYYTPDKRQIEYKGKTYRLPERFMRKSKVIDFIDAAQFERFKEQKGGNALFALPELLHLLLREDWANRTPITPEYLEENATYWHDLSMIDVLQVYFFLQRRNDILESLTQTAIEKQRLNSLEQV